MKFTLDWIKEFVDLSDIDIEKIIDKLNVIGLEVENIKKISIPNGIVIGKVLEVKDHTDSNKLHLVKVDIGKEILDIVCGASNVVKDIYVPVAVCGAVMPNGMEIKPVKLRGEMSKGMICSSSELGFDSINDGILILDDSIGKLVVGKEISEYNCFNDTIIDIDITPNRGDSNSIYGVARELATFFEKEFKREQTIKKILYSKKGIGRILSINNSTEDVNLAYMAMEFNKNSNIPLLVSLRLSLVQEYKIYEKNSRLNQLLDYFVLTTGVITKAYDVNYLRENEDDKVSLSIDTNSVNGLYEVSTKQGVVSIIGSSTIIDSNVDISTENLVLFETTYIDNILLSKLNYDSNYGIDITDTIYSRASKGSEVEITNGLSYIKYFFNKYFDVSIYTGVLDSINKVDEYKIDIDVSKINSILGINRDKIELVQIFGKLNYSVAHHTSQNIYVIPPIYKHGTKTIQDVATDILRYIGIDSIEPKNLALEGVIPNFENKISYDKTKTFREASTSVGFNETIHYIFNKSETYDKLGLVYHDKSLFLNPINENMNMLRSTLFIGLIDAVCDNRKYSNNDDLMFFEVGIVFNSELSQSNHISFIMSKNVENNKIKADLAFKKFVDKISGIIGDFTIIDVDLDNPLADNYQSGEIVVDDKNIGNIFKLHKTIEEKYKLLDTYLCDINLKFLTQDKIQKANPYSKYQSNIRDFSILVPIELKYSDIKNILDTIQFPESVIKYYPIDVYSDASLKKQKSLTIRFILQSFNSTMSEEELLETYNKIVILFKEKNFSLR